MPSLEQLSSFSPAGFLCLWRDKNQPHSLKSSPPLQPVPRSGLCWKWRVQPELGLVWCFLGEDRISMPCFSKEMPFLLIPIWEQLNKKQLE